MVANNTLSDIDTLYEQAEQVLHLAKQAGIDSAEVDVSHDIGLSVTARGGDVETIEHHQEKAIELTVYYQQRSASTSTTDLSSRSIKTIVDKACQVVKYMNQDDCNGLADAERLAYNYPDLNLYHPRSLDTTAAIDVALQCEHMAITQDARVSRSEGVDVNAYQGVDVYANTHGFSGGYLTSSYSLGCSVLAEQNREMQREHEYTCARDANDLHSLEWVAKHAAMKAAERLGARKLKTQHCPVIFIAAQARGLLRHFIAAISGSRLYQENSFLVDSRGQSVFPADVSLYQQPHLLSAIGSAPFDNEGVATIDQHYVRDGVVENYLLGSYSARQLGMVSTGNAGGVYNLSITHSDYDLAGLISEMGCGLLVTELMGQGVNLLTGDYSRGAAGFWIEGGEIQYPVEEITIAGNLRDMFLGIQAVANDIDARSTIRTGSIWINNMIIAGL